MKLRDRARVATGGTRPPGIGTSDGPVERSDPTGTSDAGEAPGGALRPGWRAAPLLLGPLVALSVLSAVGTGSSAVLIQTSPLLLIMMTPRVPFMIVAAQHTSFPVFVAAASLRLLAGDPFHYGIGRTYGAQALQWTQARLPFTRRLASITERLMSRFGVFVVAVRPHGPVLMMAGITGLRPVRVFGAAIIGTVVYSAGVYLSADRVGQMSSAGAGWLWDCRWAALSVTGAAVAGGLVWWRRRARGDGRGAGALECDAGFEAAGQPA